MQSITKTDISVQEAISSCIENKLTFAAYRLPQFAEPTLILQSSPELNIIQDLSNLYQLKGFLVSPYIHENCHPRFLISADHIFNGVFPKDDFLKVKNLLSPTKNGSYCQTPNEINKEEYLEQITQIIKAIKDNKFEKAVISRVNLLKGEYTEYLSEIFKLLCEHYSNAFVYIFHAGSHLWIGATPEPLACTENGRFITASVAGTRPLKNENQDVDTWGNKEKIEQEYVTEFIRNVLEEFNVKDFSVSEPYSKKAGNLLHLRTDFSFDIEPVKKRLGELVESLHPTSAVCGMPKDIAMPFINSLENHNREYYSGYLGPVGIEETISFFVNLRCMRVLPKQLALFVGGGITSDSVPEDEWVETEIKADTLLSIISKLIK